jgi:hypothetical protein
MNGAMTESNRQQPPPEIELVPGELLPSSEKTWRDSFQLR